MVHDRPSLAVGEDDSADETASAMAAIENQAPSLSLRLMMAGRINNGQVHDLDQQVQRRAGGNHERISTVSAMTAAR